MTERELERRAQRKLAVLRHVGEVSGQPGNTGAVPGKLYQALVGHFSATGRASSYYVPLALQHAFTNSINGLACHRYASQASPSYAPFIQHPRGRRNSWQARY